MKNLLVRFVVWIAAPFIKGPMARLSNAQPKHSDIFWISLVDPVLGFAALLILVENTRKDMFKTVGYD